ncbi:MAG: hypothetical protein RL757_2866 [Bacteroidota bacterium]|jgi:4-amino-4-deoxy-L-arabinose transferase-like glycosyltransferase
MRTNRLTFLFFIVVLAIPIFGQLQHKPIQMWDEARNGVSTVEMMQNNEYFVRYFDGKPDEWEVKPPLLLWLNMGVFKVFGINLLSLRLVSAVSMFGICLLLYNFFKREFDDEIGGAVAALMLVGSESMIRNHIARTGDHDALLCLLLFGSLITFFKYLKYQHYKYLIYTALLTAAAVLTKSVVGFFYALGFGIFLLFSWQFLRNLLAQKAFYVAVLLVVGIVGGYYGIAEMHHAGHFTHVWNMELLPRYVNENPTGMVFNVLEDKFYYVKKMIFEDRFAWWALLLPSFLFWFGWESKEKKWLAQVCWAIVLSLSAVIAMGCANDWYDAPIFVPMAILAGMVVSRLIRGALAVTDAQIICILPKSLMIFILFAAFFGFSYFKTVQKNVTLQEPSFSGNYAPAMRSLLEHHRQISDNYHVVFSEYPAPVYFMRYWAREKGVKITPHLLVNNVKPENYPKFQIGDKIFTSEQEVMDILLMYYDLRSVFEEGPSKLLEVYGLKKAQ